MTHDDLDRLLDGPLADLHTIASELQGIHDGAMESGLFDDSASLESALHGIEAAIRNLNDLRPPRMI